MNHREALKEAAGVYARRDQITPKDALSAAAKLAKRGLWSLRHISAITGLQASKIARNVTLKTERTGGRFHPDSIKPMLTMIDHIQADVVDVFVIAEAIEAGTGTSAGMVARMTGMPLSTVKWHYERAKRMRPAETPEAVAA